MGGRAALLGSRTVLPLVRAAQRARPPAMRAADSFPFFPMRRALAILACLAAGCAAPGVPRADSPVPATIGIAVASDARGVVVIAVRPGSAAQRAGVRVGDRVMRIDREAVADARQFERRVLDAPPGAMIELELRREGESLAVELPVEEISTALVG